MAKLRFANLDAEIEGDPKEIATILKELKGLNPVSPHSPNQSPSTAPDKATSREELFKRLPNKYGIAKMLEELGKPFSHNLAEQQTRYFGKIINSREEPQLYSKLYDAFAFARKQIVKNHGGRWEKFDEELNGHQTTRYTWVESKSNEEQTLQTETKIPEIVKEAKEEKGSLFNF